MIEEIALPTAPTRCQEGPLSMWKTLISGLRSILLSAILAGTADAQLTSLTEGFDTVGSFMPPGTGIFAQGWVNVNNSRVGLGGARRERRRCGPRIYPVACPLK
jgi:hypothetical protein